MLHADIGLEDVSSNIEGAADEEVSDAGPSGNLMNRNPTGRNQYGNCRESYCMLHCIQFAYMIFPAAKNDPRVKELLMKYHHQGITNPTILRDLLAQDGIEIRYILCCGSSRMGLTCPVQVREALCEGGRTLVCSVPAR